MYFGYDFVLLNSQIFGVIDVEHVVTHYKRPNFEHFALTLYVLQVHPIVTVVPFFHHFYYQVILTVARQKYDGTPLFVDASLQNYVAIFVYSLRCSVIEHESVQHTGSRFPVEHVASQFVGINQRQTMHNVHHSVQNAVRAELQHVAHFFVVRHMDAIPVVSVQTLQYSGFGCASDTVNCEIHCCELSLLIQQRVTSPFFILVFIFFYLIILSMPIYPIKSASNGFR